MTAAAWTFAVAFAVTAVLLAVIRGELDRLYAERDRFRAEARMLRGQRDIADAERAALQARLDDLRPAPASDALVLDFFRRQLDDEAGWPL